MTADEALAFVKRHGIVLESACGPVPSLAAHAAGGELRGSWWSHPRRRSIFRLTRAARDSADVLVCRLVQGHITYVHRRLWPALVRLARHFPKRRLVALRELHTAAGRHVLVTVPFLEWADPATKRAAKSLSEARAFALLEPWSEGLRARERTGGAVKPCRRG